MKISHIRLFVAVYEEGSFTAAAERENATQPGVSMQIKELEHLTGTTLFKRSTSGVSATTAGKWFYERARNVLNDVRSLEQGVAVFEKEITGTVQAGLMPAFTRSVLAPAVETFSSLFPHAKLNVIEAYSGSLVERVGRGQLDFAIVPAATVPENITARHFATDDEYFVQSAMSGLTSMKPVVLAQKENLKLILPSQSNKRRDLLNDFLEKHQIRPVETLELDTMMGTLDLIARGDWTAILPGVLCRADQGEGLRSIHPIAEGRLPLDYMLIKSASRPISPASEEFLTLLDAEVNKIIGRETPPA